MRVARYCPEPLALTGAPGPLGVAVPLGAVDGPAFIGLLCACFECVDLCAWDFDCAGCVVVCALSPACRPVFELGGLSCAKADAQTSANAPAVAGRAKRFMSITPVGGLQNAIRAA
ncbi:hypothetical protein BTHE68_38070 [Burkholderia sp. THE68]|jgi:hypothetical protein|nr:hypothetical protein BTHE68_38070 [Burkholderia sp. THE68]